MRDYLALIKQTHDDQGALSGQRDVLKTTTAKRIRERMIADIREGAVLPPVVIGVVLPAPEVRALVDDRTLSLEQLLKKMKGSQLAIIDGMQRTGAFLEAAENDKSVLSRRVRVDFWVAKSVRSLVYRMLVLNTGQVPWTLARQLTVVYAPLLAEIKQNVKSIDRILTPDSVGRRVSGAQFSSEALVELYMAFSLRKTSVDTRESLSEEFSRLDLVEKVADEAVQKLFYRTLATMAKLDLAFDNYESKAGGRFKRGRDIFSSQPARTGYIVAVAQYVLGKVGLERTPKEREARMKSVESWSQSLATRLSKLSGPKLATFLKLDVLSELLDVKVGQVGRYERSMFFEAFRLLITEEFDVPTMEPCWRAD